MNERAKVQISIGLLAYFATLWAVLEQWGFSQPLETIGILILQLILMIILSYVIIAILEWVSIFDIKTNAILTLLVLVTMKVITTPNILPVA